jgi:hypothetical protein
VLAVLVAAAVAGASASTDGRLASLAATLAWIGVAFVSVAVVAGWPSVGIAGALLLGAGFVATRFEASSGLDRRAVVLGPALLLLCELVAWSADARTSRPPGVRPATRALTIGAAIALAGALTAVVAAVTTMPIGDALGLAAVGATAVVLVAGAIVSSARSVASRA